ncbi:MAG: hypothetical protein JNM22_13945 [Saprospiraceae bacterium]|nr:hypothetical protein [Saprospiraceae bacterium]
METVRIILKVPFHQHPAGTVFDLSAETQPANWHDDDRVREKQSFHQHEYYLPDSGRGRGVSLAVSDTVPCPEHVLEGVDLRKGEARVTMAGTLHPDADDNARENPPCGCLREADVSVQINEALQSQGFLIRLPEFEEVAEKMVLMDTLRGVQVMEYVLRNYKHSDRELTWDVSDLYPGFFDLQVHFPGGWYHVVRFIKFFPMYIDPANISPAPKARWQQMAEDIISNAMATTTTEKSPSPEFSGLEEHDRRNVALAYCLEWGEMFNQPTQERMMKQFPELSQHKADELDRLAREVRSYVYGLCEQELAGSIREVDLPTAAKQQYPWLSRANINRMINVGMYYARR